MDNENEYIKVRKEKIKKLREDGINPFRNNLKPTSTIQNLIEKYNDINPDDFEKDGKSYTIAGRIVAVRSFGK